LYLKECKSGGKKLPNAINLSKNAIGKRFGIPEESQPHRAMNGVEHLIRCYQAVTSAVSE
jgi:oligoribonuclease